MFKKLYKVNKAQLQYLAHFFSKLKERKPCCMIESSEGWFNTTGIGCTCGEIFYATNEPEFRAMVNMVRMRNRTDQS